MSPGKLKFSSSSLISVVLLQLFISSLVACVVPVMSDETAQLRESCQSLCRYLMCIEKQWFATTLELLLPWIEERDWILDNLRRCIHLPVMKWDCDAPYRSALHGIYWRTCFGVQLLQLLVIFDFLSLPFNEQNVLNCVGALFCSFVLNLFLVDATLPLLCEIIFTYIAS